MVDPHQLTEVLDLERIELDVFRGRSPQVGWQRVFGGLVIAQALVAASRTVEGRTPHSLHGYFMLPGDPAIPILYEVDRIRDGRSFATRRCVAIQHGKAIFSLSASFHTIELGLEHSVPMPTEPAPEDLSPVQALPELLGDALSPSISQQLETEQPFDIRPVDPDRYRPIDGGALREPKQALWIRCRAALPPDPSIHRAVLAYLSDMTLLDTALVAHGRTIFDPSLQVASLDHALWFHRDFRADQWLFYLQDSPSAGGGRALTRGLLYTQGGRLIASVCQEGLIRFRSRQES
jgi:acyl-CoA thioesterase II